jgi:hypothetical protein
MQLKTVRKTIKTKIEDWIASIESEELRKILERDVIVTGGCITSLLMNEKVNDYDIYVRTLDTLKSVMKYYMGDFNEYNISILDGRHKDDLINLFMDDYPGYPDIKDVFNQEGVALRNLKSDQIKFYIPNNAGGLQVDYNTQSREPITSTSVAFNNVSKKFRADTKYRPMFFSPNAISLSDDIQIVVRFCGEPEEIHKNYDFIHATNYWTFDKGLVVNLNAMSSILTKQLVYQGSLYPVTSIIRVKKFVSRGWKCTAGEMFKMIYQTALLDLQNIDVLEEQLIGMDVAYFAKLIEALRSITDRSKLTPEYLFELIDRIFNDTDAEDNEN